MKTLFSLLTISLLSANLFAATLKDLNNLKPPFKLPPLPYAEDSLEPAIDKETMNIHHTKHHQAYVDNSNKELGSDKNSLLGLLKSISKKSTKVRDNVGGHWNHSFFWTVMTGNKEHNVMPEKLQKEIEKKFGSIEKFKEIFEAAGKSQFGSGWAWLIRTPQGQLEVTSTPNQDNPLMDITPKKGTPILGADVWEHAYYLKYRNKRDEYLKNFWSIVNWKQVAEYDAEAAITK